MADEKHNFIVYSNAIVWVSFVFMAAPKNNVPKPQEHTES